jgi:amino acid adenylation domain-containing protein
MSRPPDPPSASTIHRPVLDLPPGAESKDAVAWSSGTRTYGQLRRAVLRVAAQLRRLGIGRDCRVAVCLPKSIESLEVLLGVMSAGAAYVPISPASPPWRIHRQVEDAQAGLMVTTPGIASRLASDPGLSRGLPPFQPVQATASGCGLDDWLEGVPASDPPAVSADDPAAIFYTSGSTGEPKGVMLSHRNIRAFVEWAVERFGLAAEDRFLSHAPFHFDLATLDLFASLRLGASVFLLSEKTAVFAPAVARAVRRSRCTIWYSVPTALRLLLEHGRLVPDGLPSLRYVFFAGEVFPPAGLRRLMERLPRPRYVNLYGPLETNVCTYHVLPGPPDEDASEIPIGLPCEHLEVGLRPGAGNSAEPDGPGEIWVAGPSVMRGYWGRPDATRAARVEGREDSFLTGDLGVRDPEGRFHFRGRRDRQVKIRGQRVELAEIEACLAACPGVGQAAVVGAGASGSERRLVAFVVPAAEGRLSGEVLRAACAERLPAVAVPGSWRILPGLPTLTNGKLDLTRLEEWAEDIRPGSIEETEVP